MKKIVAMLFTGGALLMTNSARAESILTTQSGNDIGLSLSSYQYQEPGLMSSKGGKLGLDLRTTMALENDLFIRGDLHYAFGMVNYTSNDTGSASGEPDWYIETRGLAGEDWSIDDAELAAYTGIGYRYLFNDARGISSTGASGYRRESNYFYLPLGLNLRTELNDQAKLVSTLEYDLLLSGKQTSRLSDAGLGHSDLTNKQSNGYGVKLSIIYEKDNWAIGPYALYWNIGESDWVPLYRNGVPVFKNGFPLGGVEPQNDTTEFGVKASQKF